MYIFSYLIYSSYFISGFKNLDFYCSENFGLLTFSMLVKFLILVKIYSSQRSKRLFYSYNELLSAGALILFLSPVPNLLRSRQSNYLTSVSSNLQHCNGRFENFSNSVLHIGFAFLRCRLPVSILLNICTINFSRQEIAA